MGKWISLTCRLLIIASGFAVYPTQVTADELPSLGDTTSGIISMQQEKTLGQAWLRALRRQVRTYHDPLTYNYLTNLVYRLAPNSELTDKRLSLIIVDSPTMNAFAVPGGVMGINSGLFIHAGSEQEFASVIAHEIAHLSQRHYARSLERQQKAAPLALAGMLASIVLAVTTGGDAGIAALAGTQALSLQSRLSYSRQNEQEADRIGIITLYDSDMDPQAMPRMFERMLRESRLYGNRPPEYLSTHPVTESRISDSKNRAEQFIVKDYIVDTEFQLIRSRILLHFSETNNAAVRYFKSAIDNGNTFNRVASQYGLAIAYTKDDNPQKALPIITKLLKNDPNRIIYIVAKANILAEQNKFREGIALLKKHLARNPRNYPLTWALADLLSTTNKIADMQEAEALLVELSRIQPDEPNIWYNLAEVSGKAGNIVQLHQARAKFFYLIGEIDDALLQLQQALKKTRGNNQLTATIQQEIDNLYRAKKGINF